MILIHDDSDKEIMLFYSDSLNSRMKTNTNNRPHHDICNGVTGYNGTCIGFDGNCNGPCWSLLVIGHLLLVAC